VTRVLVTGATGFIGQHVLPVLVARGHEVHAVSSRAHSRPAQGVAWHHADLLKSGASARLADRIRPTHLLHLAWYAEPGRYWTAPENFEWVAATLQLLQAFHGRGGQRAVMAGTCAEYEWGSGVCSEATTPLKPATPYGACKHATQLLLAAYSQATGLCSAWGRVFHLYGPGEKPQRLVPQVIGALREGKPARCTSGEQVRDYLHVADVAQAFVTLLDSPQQGAVNIGSGQPVTIKQIVMEIAAQLNRPDLPALGALATPPGEPHEIVADASLLRSLGWSQGFGLRDGVRQTIEWWKGRPA